MNVGRFASSLPARLRITVLFLGAAVPLMLAILWSDLASLSDREAAVRRERLLLARSAAFSADLVVDTSITALGAVARRPELVQATDPDVIRTFLLAELAGNPIWETLGLYDGRGVNIAVTPPGIVPRSVSLEDRPHVRSVLDEDRPAVGPADISRGRGVPVISIAYPVSFPDSTHGVLLAALSLDRLGNELREVVSDVPSVSVLVVDANGRLFIHPDAVLAGQLLPLRDSAPVRATLASESGVMEAPFMGDDSLISYAPVRSAGWGVLVQEPVGVALGSIRRGQVERDSLLMLLVLISGWLAWLIGGRLSAYRDEIERRRAEAAVKVRDEFISIAAHELRSPTTVIKGSAQLGLRSLSRGRLDPAGFENVLRNVVSGVDRLSVLIDDLLDVARLREGRFPIHPEPVELGEFVEQVVRRYRMSTPDVAIVYERSPQLIPVQVDPARLDQVLDNLLSNALKYSPNGGSVTLTVTDGGPQATITIRDQGIGLPAEHRERIFEPFGRAENAMVHKLPGLGLGLYICRQIVEAHGGTIEAESAGPDRGTTMTIRLPLTSSGHDTVRHPEEATSSMLLG